MHQNTIQNMLHFLREFISSDPLFFVLTFLGVSCLIAAIKASQGKRLTEEEKRVVRANLRDWKL